MTTYELAYEFIYTVDAFLTRGYFGSDCGYFRDCYGDLLRSLDEVLLAVEEGRWTGV